MPYVKPQVRKMLDAQLCFINVQGITKGEMNYLITRLVYKWSRSLGPESYDNVSAGHSLLADAQAEWYRRVVAPYEDLKCDENGDVYV